MIDTAAAAPIAILIAVQTDRHESVFSVTDSLLELGELARTAGLRVGTMVHQYRDSPHRKTYMGSGKIEEIGQVVAEFSAEVVIADDELTPAQQKTLEQILKVKIMDRTALILDIFAKRAQTFEAQLQVEMAQLEYLLPRLTRLWTHLSRLGGGIGTKGPGEKQLEVDKRQIRKRISTIREKLDKIKLQRFTQRERRHELPLTTVAIIGYTNAGKSTLINQLTQANVFSENLLFATLDPTTRRLTLPSNESILITDTVGFIQKLPHQLVSSFRATLEEVVDADLLLHVIDVSHDNWRAMVATAEGLLRDLKADHIPQITVFNKVDALEHIDVANPEYLRFPLRCFISAKTGQRLESLVDSIDQFLASRRKSMTFHIPYSRMDVVNLIHEMGDVSHVDYHSEVTITATLNTIIGDKIMGDLGTHKKN